MGELFQNHTLNHSRIDACRKRKKPVCIGITLAQDEMHALIIL